MQLAACLLTAAGTGAAVAADCDDAMDEDRSAPAGGGKTTVSAAGQAALRCSQLARPLLTLVFR